MNERDKVTSKGNSGNHVFWWTVLRGIVAYPLVCWSFVCLNSQRSTASLCCVFLQPRMKQQEHGDFIGDGKSPVPSRHKHTIRLMDGPAVEMQNPLPPEVEQQCVILTVGTSQPHLAPGLGLAGTVSVTWPLCKKGLIQIRWIMCMARGNSIRYPFNERNYKAKVKEKEIR